MSPEQVQRDVSTEEGVAVLYDEYAKARRTLSKNRVVYLIKGGNNSAFLKEVVALYGEEKKSWQVFKEPDELFAKNSEISGVTKSEYTIFYDDATFPEKASTIRHMNRSPPHYSH